MSSLRFRSRLLAALVLSVIAGLVPTGAWGAEGRGKSRVETADYAIGLAGYATKCDTDPYGCVWFEVRRGERYISLEIEDATGQPTYASIYTYGYTDGTDDHEHICARSEGSLYVPREVKYVAVVIDAAGGADGCPSAGTNGTVTATFSNRAAHT